MKQLQNAKKIFLDTSPLIYWLEKNERYLDLLFPVFSSIHEGQKQAVSSHITLIEILAKPMLERRKDLVSKYKNLFLEETYLTVANLDGNSCEAAAYFKAKYRFKTPDAIQLGLAVSEKAEIFLTNDSQLKKAHEIPVVCLE